MNIELEAVNTLFHSYCGHKPDSIEPLPASGSYRQYYRLKFGDKSFLAAYNADRKENIAFISFTKTFLSSGLKVPEIYCEDIENNVYLLQDLGNTTLLNYLSSVEANRYSQPDKISIYKKVLAYLPVFQVKGGMQIDYSVCYPRHAFDKQSMLWDLNYFKYYFLKLARIPFDEQHLEYDFQSFSDFLLETDCSCFMYRDFQSRNIMLVENEPYFIDYQGGRRGAVQYDIASILFEAKTSLDSNTREVLLYHYLDILKKYAKTDEKAFMKYYYGYVYIRLMQAMGAYGFRGLYEKKELFLQSIPKALEHLKWLRSNIKLPGSFPELEKVWDNLIESDRLKNLTFDAEDITVVLNSFSYRKGIPADETSNGGGFVFDCRLLNNPGKLEKFKNHTGLDLPVIEYLEADSKVTSFLQNIFSIIDHAVESYKLKGYKSLMVNFGCTGGRHRSVYTSEKLFVHLLHKYPGIKLVKRHRELD
jgi:aminoglycoside/choline kinase family phosphotransferase